MKKYIINKIWSDGVKIYSEELDVSSTKKEALKLYKKHLEREKTDENSMMKNILDNDNDVIDAKEWFLATSKTKPQKVMIEIKEVNNG